MKTTRRTFLSSLAALVVAPFFYRQQPVLPASPELVAEEPPTLYFSYSGLDPQDPTHQQLIKELFERYSRYYPQYRIDR